MKGIKEKQMLVNMARALGQAPDPLLLKEVEDYNNLIQNITPVAGNEFNLFLEELSNLKKQVKLIEDAPVIFEKVSIDFPKPPTVEELLDLYTESHLENTKVKLSEDIILSIKDEDAAKKIPTLVDLVSQHITQEAKIEERSPFNQPDITGVAAIKTLDDVRRKLKHLEEWVSRISASPGSGEVNLLRLDDVDTSGLGDSKALFYNATTAKLEFRTVSGGGGAVDSVNGQTGVVSLTTTDIAEGTNKYFTNARAVASLTAGTNISLAANGLISSTASGGSANLLAVSSAMIPNADSVHDLGTANLRWGTLYLANNTIDLGGALISSDGSGTITISSQGAVLPVNSKVSVDGIDKSIALVGNTGAVTTIVPFYTKNAGLNTIATHFSFGANPDDYVFTNFTFNDGTSLIQPVVAQFYF